jgi:hypothetical protein
MTADEVLSRKMSDATRRLEEEEADARKPYLAMLERERQTKEGMRELAAQAAAKIESREALFKVSGLVKAVNPSFSEREIEVLRFLKAEVLAKGERPADMSDSAHAVFHRDVKAKFNLSGGEYRELVSRFEALGIVDYNVHALDAPNGILHLKSSVTEWVRHIDEEARRKKAEPPNRLDEAKRWAFSKWWIVGPVVVLLVVVWLINQFKPILEWFGLKK